MKRIFPIIVLLITLSLLGLILLQVSWFKNMLSLRQAQLLSKVEEACFDVAMDLSVQASSAPTLKLPRSSKAGLLTDEFNFGLSRTTISQNHSFFEINEKLQKKFEEKGLKNVQFEFAISSNSNLYNIEMQSKNFIKESEDTTHNRTIISEKASAPNTTHCNDSQTCVLKFGTITNKCSKGTSPSICEPD